MRFFYLPYEAPIADLADKLQAMAISLNVSLVKSGGVADGPLQLIFTGDAGDPGAGLAIEFGIPARGTVSASGKYRARTTEPFRCAYRSVEAAGPALIPAMAQLAEEVRAANHSLSGESRLVITPGNSGSVTVEIQLGIE